MQKQDHASNAAQASASDIAIAQSESRDAQSEPEWAAEKAAIDSMDDGDGPFMYWAMRSKDGESIRAMWKEFLALTDKHLGRGFSLACFDGQIVDDVTATAFEWYMVGCAARTSSDPAQ